MDHDVIIAGGGMVGMSLAIALARAGMSVGLIERTEMAAQLEPAFDGRVSAIALGSKRILDGIGAWDGMKDYAEPITDIRVSDGATPFFLHYGHFEIERETGGEPFGYIVENRYIRHSLQKAAQQLSPLMMYDKTGVASFERNDASVSVQLTNGKTLSCRLLIGADGKQSSIRKMAGIDTVEWNYGQTAIVCTIAHSLSHHGLAQERFLPAGPFAVLPMMGNRSSLVWVEPDERVKLYLELPDDELVQEIRERTGDYLGEIKLAGGRFSYPLSLMHAKQYTAQRVALIGDAAHAIHPIAGQGVNLGFRDVAAISELLIKQFGLGLDIGAPDVLSHYQRWRRFDNVTMLAVTDGLNRLFSHTILPIKTARNLGMWAVSKMPPVKRFFMRHAMGLSGDLPELIRKKTI